MSTATKNNNNISARANLARLQDISINLGHQDGRGYSKNTIRAVIKGIRNNPEIMEMYQIYLSAEKQAYKQTVKTIKQSKKA